MENLWAVTRTIGLRDKASGGHALKPKDNGDETKYK